MVLSALTHGREILQVEAGAERSLVPAEHHQLVDLQLFIPKLEFSCLGIRVQTRKDPKHLGRVARQTTTTDLQKQRVTHWVARVLLELLLSNTQCQQFQSQLQLLD